MKDLHRLSVANFSSENMHALEKLQTLREAQAFSELDASLLPIEAITTNFPQLKLTTAAAFRLQQGQVLNDISSSKVGLVNLYNEYNTFLGVGEIAANGALVAKRLIKIV